MSYRFVFLTLYNFINFLYRRVSHESELKLADLGEKISFTNCSQFA